MKKIILPISITILLFLTSCSGNQEKKSNEKNLTKTGAVESKSQNVTKGKLLFFMNPNGYPCQMQDNILRQNINELSQSVEIVYYKTTIKSDINKFYQFGIRGLPTMILVDASGKEIKRFSPGIQRYEVVKEGIDLLK